MKKSILRYTGTIALLLFSVLPVSLTAQALKDVYQRPGYWRPYDQSGINVFETTKQPDSIAFDGLRIRFGAGFTQQFQGLKHQNSNATGTNKLYAITPGFNTAMANLNLDVELADGIRLNLVTYLST